MAFDLFGGLTEEDRRRVTSTLRRRSYSRGTTLFFEGDRGDSLHLIEQGHVAVRISTPEGDQATLAVLGPGSCLGEQALLDADERRGASAVALDAVETRSLTRPDFDGLRRSHPSVERFLVDVLAARVTRLSRMVLEAMYLPAEQRVVRRLAELADIYDGDRAARRDDDLDIPIRQEDLASMAGTTRPTANRVLRQLHDEGIIEVRRAHLLVIDRARLDRRAR